MQMRALIRQTTWMLTACLLQAAPVAVTAQEVTATLHVKHAGTATMRAANAAGVVVWLTPLDRSRTALAQPLTHLKLVQKGKLFSPHILIVPVGSSVEFPNQDPFFHNVFSLFNGKRFDLGLYESGSTRYVRFDHEGVSYIFCNIHPEMSAVVVALATPYYAVSGAGGEVTVHDVPAGQYELHVWAEGVDEPQLRSLARHVHIGASGNTLGVIQLTEVTQTAAHKNKFAEEYPAALQPTYGPAQMDH